MPSHLPTSERHLLLMCLWPEFDQQSSGLKAEGVALFPIRHEHYSASGL